MNWLPDTRDQLLRATIVSAEIGCLSGVYISIYRTVHYGLDLGIVLLFFLAAVGFGLWKLRYWGRRLAIAYLWLLLFVIGGPVGKLSILDAINAAHPPYPLWKLWWEEVFPIAAPIAFLLEVLTAYRREFDDAPGEQEVPGSMRVPRSWVSWCMAVYVVPTLMVAVIVRGANWNGGCPPAAIWIGLAGLVAVLGCFLFVTTAGQAYNRKARILRAAIYLLGALCLLQGAPSYLWYASGCRANP